MRRYVERSKNETKVTFESSHHPPSAPIPFGPRGYPISPAHAGRRDYGRHITYDDRVPSGERSDWDAHESDWDTHKSAWYDDRREHERRQRERLASERAREKLTEERQEQERAMFAKERRPDSPLYAREQRAPATPAPRVSIYNTSRLENESTPQVRATRRSRPLPMADYWDLEDDKAALRLEVARQKRSSPRRRNYSVDSVVEDSDSGSGYAMGSSLKELLIQEKAPSLGTSVGIPDSLSPEPLSSGVGRTAHRFHQTNHSILRSTYTGDALEKNMVANLAVDSSGSENTRRSRHALFNWVHLHDPVLHLSAFSESAINASGLDDRGKTDIRKLLEGVRQKFECASPPGRKGKWMEPHLTHTSFFQKTHAKSNERRSLLFVCLPFLSLERYSSPSIPDNSAAHPAMSLLQSRYPSVGKERDLQQAICKLGSAEKGHCLHVSQLWCLIVDHRLLITCARLTPTQLHGPSINITRKLLADPLDYTKLPLIVSDGANRTWLLDLAEYDSWFKFISSFVEMTTDLEESLDLFYKGSKLEKNNWPDIIKESRKALVRVLIRRKPAPKRRRFPESSQSSSSSEDNAGTSSRDERFPSRSGRARASATQGYDWRNADRDALRRRLEERMVEVEQARRRLEEERVSQKRMEEEKKLYESREEERRLQESKMQVERAEKRLEELELQHEPDRADTLSERAEGVKKARAILEEQMAVRRRKDGEARVVRKFEQERRLKEASEKEKKLQEQLEQVRTMRRRMEEESRYRERVEEDSARRPTVSPSPANPSAPSGRPEVPIVSPPPPPNEQYVEVSNDRSSGDHDEAPDIRGTTATRSRRNMVQESARISFRREIPQPPIRQGQGSASAEGSHNADTSLSGVPSIAPRATGSTQPQESQGSSVGSPAEGKSSFRMFEWLIGINPSAASVANDGSTRSAVAKPNNAQQESSLKLLLADLNTHLAEKSKPSERRLYVKCPEDEPQNLEKLYEKARSQRSIRRRRCSPQKLRFIQKAQVLLDFFLYTGSEATTMRKCLGALRWLLEYEGDDDPFHPSWLTHIKTIDRTAKRVRLELSSEGAPLFASLLNKEVVAQHLTSIWVEFVLGLVSGTDLTGRSNVVDNFISSERHLQQLLDEVRKGVHSKTLAEREAVTPIGVMALLVSRVVDDVMKDGIQVITVYWDYLSRLELEIRDDSLNRGHQGKINHLRQEIEALLGVLGQQCRVLTDLEYSLSQTSGSGLDFLPSLSTPRELVLINDCLSRVKAKEQSLKEMLDCAAGMAAWNLRAIESNKDRQESAILAFTIVTVIFLPLSFIASVFGMNVTDIRNISQSQWIFWVVAIPVTVIVVLLTAYLAGDVGDMKEGVQRLLGKKKVAAAMPPSYEMAVGGGERIDGVGREKGREVRGRRRRTWEEDEW